MRSSEFDLEAPRAIRRPSPNICIYCLSATSDLTDEHVIPFALAANTLILEKSCCKKCQHIIQPYEQDVLKKQLGNFRAQVCAPTRNPKSRPTEIRFGFSEVDATGQIVRDLGSRMLPNAEAPITLNLWSSPPPRYGLPSDQIGKDVGQPWSYIDKPAAMLQCKVVASETGAVHVAMKLGEVNRENYLRFLAKTAHAYAAAQLGPDGFEPFLPDVILKRSDKMSVYVGDYAMVSPFEPNPAHTLQISLGEQEEGPAMGCLLVRIQLYPFLDSPSHIIIVGRVTPMTRDRLSDAIDC